MLFTLSQLLPTSLSTQIYVISKQNKTKITQNRKQNKNRQQIPITKNTQTKQNVYKNRQPSMDGAHFVLANFSWLWALAWRLIGISSGEK